MKHNIIRKIVIFLLVAGLIAAAGYSAVRLITFRYPLKYRDIVEKYSEQYDLDPYLVLAVINVESRFRHDAVSPRNARGLMQITGKTGGWIAGKLQITGFSEEKLFDPQTNIMMGCWYLSTLYHEFGDLDLMLAAYNAGSGNVSQWLKDSRYSANGKSLDQIPFRETEQYLEKVKRNQKIYKRLYKNAFDGKFSMKNIPVVV